MMTDDRKLSITVDLNVSDLERQIIDKLTTSMYLEVKTNVQTEVKAIIVSEIRTQIRQQVSLILDTTILEDGRTFQQYVHDKLMCKNIPGEPRYGSTRLDLHSLVTQTVDSKVREWFRELVEPKLHEIKEKIKSEFIAKLLS